MDHIPKQSPQDCEESVAQLLNMYPGQVHLLPQTPQLHYLFTVIRNRETQRTDFVFYSERIMRLILEAALCLIPMHTKNVVTPTGDVYKGVQPDEQGIIGVSILRAGESMERVLREMCRGVRIGKILVQRDEASEDKAPDSRYNYSKLPKDVATRHVLLLDPMIATGGSAIKATEILIQEYGVKEENIIFLNLVAAPAGIKRYLGRFPKIQFVTAAIDDGMNEERYIVPGLGDFGDRYFGTIE
ncbi:uracil phosphoribosyltransferase [Angomonas deanei]|nr:uracil phosphoribosyltransferase [Angomonas deanei]|eukprot:EPY41648.1 uracil phosphoribosyltransferase [Angomonas deanei]